MLRKTDNARGSNRASRDFRLQMEGYGLTTAEIAYHMPDSRGLIQLYIWQEYDLAPRFPQLRDFLRYWSVSLDGPLHSVRVAHRRLIGPSEWRAVDGVIKLN